MEKAKSKYTLILAFLMLLAIIILPLTSVYSANDKKVKLETNKQTAIYGDEVTVTLNFEKEENNLYAYTAKLSYDKDVFEEIVKEDFQESGNWQDVTYNSNNNKFGLINKEGSESQNIIEVKLRVKENAKRGKTVITVNNATASNGERDISLGSASTEVTIKEDELDNLDNIEETNIGSAEENQEGISTTVEKNTNWYLILTIVISATIIAFLIYMFSKYSVIDKKKRGIISIISLILLALVLIVGIPLSRKNQKDVNADVNNDNKVDYEDSKELMEYLLEVDTPQTTLDVNADGQVSTTDVARTIKTVRNKNDIKANVKSADTTGGKTSKKRPIISVASGSTGNNGNSGGSGNTGNSGSSGGSGSSGSDNSDNQGETPTQNPPEQEPTIMPTATTPVITTASPESPTPEIKFPGKEGIIQANNGENIELILEIELTSETEIKQVIIKNENGKEEIYDVEYNKEDGLYHAILPNPYSNSKKKYGKTTYQITGVVLDNGNKVKLEKDNYYTISVDVLKQIPSIDSFVYNESAPSVTLTIEDRDEAIIDGGYIYLKDEQNQNVIASAKIKSYETEGTKKKVTIDISEFEIQKQGLEALENGVYNFLVNLPCKPSEEESTIVFLSNADQTEGSEGPFEFDMINIVCFNIKDFDLKEIKVANVSRTENYAEITFKSTNNSYTNQNVENYYVTHIMVEGIDNPIEVTRGNEIIDNYETFTAKVPYQNLDENRTFKIIGAKVLGGKEFWNRENSYGSFEIFKAKPEGTITDARIISEGENAGKIEVKFKIEKNIDTIKSLKLKVLDKDGATLFTTSDAQVAVPQNSDEQTVILEHLPKYAGTHTIQLIVTGVELNDGNNYGEIILNQNSSINIPYSAEVIATKMHVIETNETSTNKTITAAKGNQVQIDYTIKTNRPATENLDSLTIKATGNNDKSYNVGENGKITLDAPISIDKEKDTATYKVVVTVPQGAAPTEEIKYQIETVQFDGNQANYATVPENVATIKVQKQVPEILSVTYDYQTRTISVKVRDEDNAITDGKIVITDGETPYMTKTFGTNATESEDKLEATQGVYNIKLPEDQNIEQKTYKVVVTGNYDIGKGSQPLKQVDSTIKVYNGDYGFKLDDVKVSKVENTASSKNVYINFHSTNNHNIPVKAAIVLEQEEPTQNTESSSKIIAKQTKRGLEHRCEVTRVVGSDNQYQIKIPFDTDTPKKYTLEQLILENSAAFDKQNSTEFKAEQLKVFKEKPFATDLELNLEKRTAKFAINDKDSAILVEGTTPNVKVIIIDADTQKTVTEIAIPNLSDRTVTIPENVTIPQGSYKLAIQATYDRLDGKGKVTENIGITEETAEQELVTKITKIETDKKLYNRSETINVTIDVEDNTSYPIYKFVIECQTADGKTITHEDYPDEEENVGTYTFSAELSATQEDALVAGIRKYSVKEIVYKDKEGKEVTPTITPSEKNSVEIEIIKDAPTLTWKKQVTQDGTNLIINLENPDKAEIVHVSEKEDSQFEAGATIKLQKQTGTDTYDDVDIGEYNKLIGTSEEEKQSGKATRTIELNEQGTYFLQVNGIAYLADSIRNSSELQTITKPISIEQKNIKIVTDYNFKIQNEKLVSIDENAKTATIEFESTNSANEVIKNITIDENVFEAESLQSQLVRTDGDLQVFKYTVTLPNIEPGQRKDISFKKATLSDGKDFQDVSNKITIYKTKPTATIDATIDLAEGENQNNVDANRTIKGSATITDTDNTISKTEINVEKPDGTMLYEENQTLKDGVFDFSEKKVNQKGDYIVKLYITHDANDGKGQVIKEETKTLTINVDSHIIKNQAESYYVEKNAPIKIHYTIEDNADDTERFSLKGAKVVITKNGVAEEEQLYTLTPTGTKENEEYYDLELKAPDTAQEMSVEIKAIQYFDTKNETDAFAEMNSETDDNITKLEVLKQEINISDYAFDGEKNLRFNLNDPDGAFTEGKVKIEEQGEATSDPVEIKFTKPENGNRVSIDETSIPEIKAGYKYKITIEASFDRTISSDTDLGDKNKYQGTITNAHEFHKIEEYNFKYEEPLKIESVDEVNKILTLSFKCSFIDTEGLELDQAYIAGAFRDVEKQADGSYKLTMNFGSTQNTIELQLLAVKFSNGRILKKPNFKDETIGENEGKNEEGLSNTDKAYAFLAQPYVTDGNARFEDGKLKVSFKLNDTAKTVTNIKAQIMIGDESQTKVDSEQNVQMPTIGEDGTATVEFEVEKEYKDAGIYTVKLLFTHNRHTGIVHEDEALEGSTFTAELKSKAKIVTDNRQEDNKYVERGEENGETEIPVIYTIEDNETKDVKAIKLENDDTEIPVEKVAESKNQYKAIFKTKTESGVKSFKVAKVVYNQYTVDLDEIYETSVEILKIAPTIGNVQYKNSDRSVTFTVIDPEDTITEGVAEITSENEETVYKTVKLNSSENEAKTFTITFTENDKGESIPITEVLMLKITATYSLAENNKKICNNVQLAKERLAPLNLTYNVELQDVKVKTVDRANTTAKLELTIKDNSADFGEDKEQYRIQNFKIKNGENEIRTTFVSQDENTGLSTYTADFPYLNELDGKRQEYTINELTVGANEKEVEPRNFVLFKTKPKAVNLKVDDETITENSATASFEIEDPDNALINLRAGLYEYKYYVDYNQYMDIDIDQREIAQEEDNNYTVILDNQNYSTNSEYIVKVEGDFDLADGSNFETDEITKIDSNASLLGTENDATKHFTVPIRAKIEEVVTPEDVTNKDNSVTTEKATSIPMYYRISDNTDLAIKQLVLTTVEDPNYQTTVTATRVTTGEYKPQEGQEGEVYKINYGGKTQTQNWGEQHIKVKDVKYDRSRVANTIEENQAKLFKIKKLIPTLNYVAKGTLDTAQATINIEDTDKALKDNQVTIEIWGAHDELNDSTDVEPGKQYFENQTITVTTNEEHNIDFTHYGEQLPDGLYDLKIKGTYNLYGNDNPDDNIAYEEVKSFQVMRGLNITISSLRLMPELASYGTLMGYLQLDTNKTGLAIQELTLRVYKNPDDIDDTNPEKYVDHVITSINDYGENLYAIVDENFRSL